MRVPPLVEPGPPLTAAEVQRWSRHLLLPQVGATGQRRLAAARVCVVGAGGLGAPVLQYLAAAGVGHLGIVDVDVVELSNLQRQVLHGTADVGRAKVDSARDAVHAIDPRLDVVVHRERLTDANADAVLGGYDLVIDGTDNFPTRYAVNDACVRLGVPEVWGSVLRFDAQVAVFWGRPPDGVPAVQLRDLFPAPPPPGSVPSCAEGGVLGALCGQVGSVMATEAVKLITGTGEPLLGRVLVLDALAARWTEVPLVGDPVRAGQAARAGQADRAGQAGDAGQVGQAGQAGPAGLPGQEGQAREAASSELPVAVARSQPSVRSAAPARREEPARREAPAGREEPAAGVVPVVPVVPVEPGVPVVTARALADRLAARDRGEDRFVLVDVREPGERDVVAIPGAVGVPLGRILDGAADLPRDVPLVLHCRSGVRSAQAGRALLAAGHPDVRHVDGGVLAWVADVDPSLPTY